MARSQEEDSADSQWYIAETEAHNLDPENRDDGGYATFGVVRDGMSHVRAIALTPTSDDPTGLENLQNPASSAGRPIYEARINEISLLGVVLDPNASVEESEGPEGPTTQSGSSEGTSGISIFVTIGILGALTAIAMRAARIIEPVEFHLPDEAQD